MKYRCPKCKSNRLIKFNSNHYGLYARKCKKCGTFGSGAFFADAARKLKERKSK